MMICSLPNAIFLQPLLELSTNPECLLLEELTVAVCTTSIALNKMAKEVDYREVCREGSGNNLRNVSLYVLWLYCSITQTQDLHTYA